MIIIGAPAAHAGISQCTISTPGIIGLGPMGVRNVDAVCSSKSQLGDLNVPRIRTNYGYAYLPEYIEICNCETQSAWFRFRETDTLNDFQIEVEGRHNDQNAASAGYRPPFKLAPIAADTGGCQRFSVTYRTSASRPFHSGASVPVASSEFDAISFTTTLQRNPSTSSTPPAANDPGWSNVGASVTISGKVWRRIRFSSTSTSDPINFNSCDVQNGGVTTRIGESSTDAPAVEESASTRSAVSSAD